MNTNQDWSNLTPLKKKDDDLEGMWGPKKKTPLAQYDSKLGGPGKREAKGSGKKKKVVLSLGDFNKETADDILNFFNSLPERGTINPAKVRFSQDSVNSWYTQPFTANGVRVESLIDHISALKDGKIDPNSTPEIDITFVDGFIVTLSNRRLKVHREANKPIRYNKVKLTDDQLFKFTADKLYENISVR